MEFLGSLIQQINVSTQSFGVWIPLAFGLIVGLAYVIASAAKTEQIIIYTPTFSFSTEMIDLFFTFRN